MDNQPSKPASGESTVRVLKIIRPRPGSAGGARTMARLERQAARRRWLMISSAVAAALVAGVLIGRFLIP